MIRMYALSYYIEIALSQFGADISYFLHLTALGETDLNNNGVGMHECITKLFGHRKGGFSRKSN